MRKHLLKSTETVVKEAAYGGGFSSLGDLILDHHTLLIVQQISEHETPQSLLVVMKMADLNGVVKNGTVLGINVNAHSYMQENVKDGRSRESCRNNMLLGSLTFKGKG